MIGCFGFKNINITNMVFIRMLLYSRGRKPVGEGAIKLNVGMFDRTVFGDCADVRLVIPSTRVNEYY